MINKIIRFSVDHRGIVLGLTMMIAIVGWFSFQELAIDAVPDITNTQVQVYAQVEGLAPEEIERNITFPVENAMAGVSGVTEVRSITRFGLSQVTIVFEDGTDIYRSRQLVSERLQTVANQLPKNILPKLGPISTGLGEIFFYAIEAEKVEESAARVTQLMELRAIQDWYVRPRLLTVKGVAEVNTIGGFEKQFHVQPDPEKMARYAIHFTDITEALEATNRNVGGGYVQQTVDQFLVQGIGLLESAEDIEATPVKSLENFQTIYIRDIAKVRQATELRTGAAMVHGQEAVLGTVFMLIGENGRAVSTRVAEKLKEIETGLPPGFKIRTLYDRSTLVNKTLNTVEHNLLLGAILVIVVLLFLLGNARAAAITAMVIPLTILILFIVMRRFGISGNLLSLGALDFGIIVDGAVIVLDHCVRGIHDKTQKLGRSLTSKEVKETVYHSTVEIRTAAGFGELIVVVGFLPILALTGIEGKMFKPMAANFGIAVIAALALSFTKVPALASLILKGNAKDKEPWLMQRVASWYQPILAYCLQRSKKVLTYAGASLVAAIIIFAFLGGEFLPQMDEASRTIQFVRPVNVTLDHSLETESKSHKIIAEFPQVQNVFSRIGTAEVATDPMGVNLSDTFIMFKERSDWPDPSKTWKDISKEITERLAREIPGQRVLLSQPIQMRFNELLEGTRADISVKVFGEDMETLSELTTKIAEKIKTVRGAGDVEVELRGKSPILKITPDAQALGRLNVPKREVLEAIEIAIGGEEAGFIYDGIKRYPLIVRLSEADRSNLNSIRGLPVSIGANIVLPVSDVATIQFDEAFGVITREQTKRRAAVMINLRGRDTESFVLEAQEVVKNAIKLPPGYYLEWGGNFKNLQAARSKLMVFAPLALVLVLAMI